MFANYEYYINNYMGNRIGANEFTFYAKKSTTLINLYTFHRIRMLDDNIKDCCCALAEYLFSADKVDGNELASESLGNRSVSYKTGKSNAEKNKEVRNIIASYLANTGLMYGGINV